LSKVLEHLRAGDVLVIWKLDRLGRSLKHLIEVVNELMTRKIGLKSLNDPIDTTTAQGRLIFNLFASLSEFERDVIRERTQAGLSAARARGRNGGRPKGLPSRAEPTACAAETLYREGKLSTREIAARLQQYLPFGRIIESKKSLEVYQHLSLESVDKAYQDAVQSVGI
jgi:DNA invertase Pin-like site-specific DNA recombinase